MSKIIWIFPQFFFSLNNINLGTHFLFLTFFDNFNFYSTLFSEMEAVFWRKLHKCTQGLKKIIGQIIAGAPLP